MCCGAGQWDSGTKSTENGKLKVKDELTIHSDLRNPRLMHLIVFLPRPLLKRLPLVAIGALELRDVAEVYRMLEGAVGLMTRGALPRVSVAEVHRVLEDVPSRNKGLSCEGLVESRVTDPAFIPDHFAFGT